MLVDQSDGLCLWWLCQFADPTPLPKRYLKRSITTWTTWRTSTASTIISESSITTQTAAVVRLTKLSNAFYPLPLTRRPFCRHRRWHPHNQHKIRTSFYWLNWIIIESHQHYRWESTIKCCFVAIYCQFGRSLINAELCSRHSAGTSGHHIKRFEPSACCTGKGL